MRSLKAVLASVCLTGLVGCGGLLTQHVEQFDTMRAMAASVADRLEGGTFAQMQVAGQGINPGIRVEAGQIFYASAKYDGLSGQFMSSAMGKLDPSEGGSENMWETANSKNKARADVREKVAEAIHSRRQGTPVASGEGSAVTEVVPAKDGLAVTVTDVDVTDDKAFGRVDGKLVAISGGGLLKIGETVLVRVDEVTPTLVKASLP